MFLKPDNCHDLWIWMRNFLMLDMPLTTKQMFVKKLSVEPFFYSSFSPLHVNTIVAIVENYPWALTEDVVTCFWIVLTSRNYHPIRFQLWPQSASSKYYFFLKNAENQWLKIGKCMSTYSKRILFQFLRSDEEKISFVAFSIMIVWDIPMQSWKKENGIDKSTQSQHLQSRKSGLWEEIRTFSGPDCPFGPDQDQILNSGPHRIPWRGCCRHLILPCHQLSHPICIPVSQSQDFSTTEHPFDSLSHNMFCSVRNLYEEAPRGEDFTHHHIQEVSHTLAFHLIHPFHLGQGSLPHHLWPQPSEIYLISISGNNCVCTVALHFHNFLQHIYSKSSLPIKLLQTNFHSLPSSRQCESPSSSFISPKYLSSLSAQLYSSASSKSTHFNL